MNTEKVNLIEQIEVDNIFNDIKELIVNSRNKVYTAVNTEMLNLYWNIGKIIMEIQDGEERAVYGEKIIGNISERLKIEFGKGLSVRNLRRMRQFYCLFPIRSSLMTELTWTHYLVIIGIEEEQKRNFYLKETINSK